MEKRFDNWVRESEKKERTKSDKKDVKKEEKGRT